MPQQTTESAPDQTPLSTSLESATIAVVGLGYVGLPLTVAFGRRRKVIGFDINARRIAQLKGGEDHTGEVSGPDLAAARHLSLTDDPTELAGATAYIITVPTPVDEHQRPDLSPLIGASRTVGKVLKPGDIVIYESTVYPRTHADVAFQWVRD